MIFSTPVWLWLGSAVLIPVLIHLWNKRSGKPRLLGTFRFLPEESFASAKRIELHEIPLMLIRIVLVALVILLLANLSWKSETEIRELVTISELNSEKIDQTKNENGNPVLEFSSAEIDAMGWWNLLAQADHDYHPVKIIVKGDFSAKRFNEIRPEINAGIDWQQNDSLVISEKIVAAWMGSSGESKALIHRRTDVGISTNIETLQEEPEQVLNEVKLILNSKNPEEVNLGLSYAATLWDIAYEEQQISESAQFTVGDDQIVTLSQSGDESGAEDLIGANAWTGISFQVTDLDTGLIAAHSILASRDKHTPFLFEDEDGNLVVNGNPDRSLKSWVFVGVGNQLIRSGLDIEASLWPIMDEVQRNPVFASESGASDIPEEQRSARLWLIGLLAALWLLERWLAPKRGM
jgi:hypothetical protein